MIDDTAEGILGYNIVNRRQKDKKMKEKALYTGRYFVVYLLIAAVFFSAPAFLLLAEGSSSGSRKVITTSYQWVSEDPDDYEWIIDKEGTPKEVWVIDQEAREKISHMEMIHHDAVVHEEVVDAIREVFVFREFIISTAGSFRTVDHVFYDLSDEEVNDYISSGRYDLIDNYREHYDKTITVVDEEAYDQEEEIIDQYASEEKGHYETVMEGEEGHFEMKKDVVPGEHEGYYEARTVIDKE